MKKKVAVGLSGGVDSSVAAYLLKEQGYELIGIYMQNWHDTEGILAGDCPSHDDIVFAKLVAKKLDIPFHLVDLSSEYKQRVVDYMFSEYEAGRTPNPDVLCNREIKFDVFWKVALEFGVDYVATGHYCRKDEIETPSGTYYRLLAGKDPNKDQSYFLCQLDQEQLKTALFPIGHLQKSEVRAIAAKMELATAERKDSQGICFIGKVDLPTFLQQKLSVKKGRIVEIAKDTWFYGKRKDLPFEVDRPGEDALQKICRPYHYLPKDGVVVGEHRGAHFFTIGQRKGLNVGGKAEPLFVIATDTELNVVYVGQGHDHPGLNRRALKIEASDAHWVRPDKRLHVGESAAYQVRIRYRQELQNARIHCLEDGLYLHFEQHQRGIASGQFAAWYENEELIGSGVIR